LNVGVTPAIRALEAAEVPFTLHPYDHDPGTESFGEEAASALGLDPDRVFKTLVVTADRGPAVAIVPVLRRLAPKAVAVALGVKRVEMCAPAEAQRITGYVVGGISPFGQRRRLPTVVDATCQALRSPEIGRFEADQGDPSEPGTQPAATRR
jgi:Cys-tRNA(Pro)/Cys-tRNA(Cys) deacylase